MDAGLMEIIACFLIRFELQVLLSSDLPYPLFNSPQIYNVNLKPIVYNLIFLLVSRNESM